MKAIWTARKRSWTSESSGFPSLESMVAWREARASSVAEIEERLLLISFDGERIFFSDSRDRDLHPLDELGPEEKKHLRFSYQEWLKKTQDIYRQSEEMGQEDWMKAVEPDQVKLFASIGDGQRDWAMAWGVDLKNAKENFFPKYASIQPAPLPMDGTDDLYEDIQTDFQTTQPDRPTRQPQNSEPQGEPGYHDNWVRPNANTARIVYVEREVQSFEDHFIRHRFVYTGFAVLIFVLGLIHATFFRW